MDKDENQKYKFVKFEDGNISIEIKDKDGNLIHKYEQVDEFFIGTKNTTCHYNIGVTPFDKCSYLGFLIYEAYNSLKTQIGDYTYSDFQYIVNGVANALFESNLELNAFLEQHKNDEIDIIGLKQQIFDEKMNYYFSSEEDIEEDYNEEE